jgi:predicted nucleic acid-binding protein
VAEPEALVVDTSVLVRFFHDYEDDVQDAAARVWRWWEEERVELVLLDLGVYEFVNVLVRGLRLAATHAEQAIAKLFDLGLPVIRMDHGLVRAACVVAAETGVSGYDAAFVAAARRLDVPLLTADRRLAERCPEDTLLVS